MRKSLALVVIAAICGALLLFAFSRSESERDSADVQSARDAQAELRQLRSQLEDLRGEVHQARAATQDVQRALPATAQQLGRQPSPTAPPVTQAAASEFDRKYHAHADTVFYAEARDASWSPEVTLSAKLSTVLPRGSAIRKLECRSTLCRVETWHPDADTYALYLSAAFGPPPPDQMDRYEPLWRGTTTFVRTNDPAHQEVLTVGYLARENRTLPAIPQDEEELLP